MGRFKSFLTRFAIELFLLLFIYPAIGFGLLVIGFTSSWKSGTLMLVSALLIRFLLKREAATIRPGFRKSRTWGRSRRRSRTPGAERHERAGQRAAVRSGTRSSGKSAGKRRSPSPGFFDQGTAPPQLSDIYADIATQMREQETLLAMLREQDAREADGHPEARHARPGHPAGCRCSACSLGSR